MNRRIALWAVAFLALTAGGGQGEGDKEHEKLMKKKLEHAQKVLEGVAIKDFDMIAKHSEELIAISKEAEWKVMKTPRYEVHSNEFRRAADALAKDAKDKNLDAAALSYVDLTLSCVKCHKYVREERRSQVVPGGERKSGRSAP